MPADWTEALLERWAALEPDLDLEPYLVTARISRLALHIARSQEDVFGRFGLNRGEAGVLSALRTAGRRERLTPTRLFKGLMLSSAGMTKRLDALEQRGLVRRLPDPEDRRGVHLELTPEGRRLIDRAVAANTAAEARLVEGLGSRERKLLASLLGKLLAAVEG
jgi:DNA-binding MarR family transcriptional regulator